MDKISKCILGKLDSSKCVGCGACINCCPTDALSYNRDSWGYYVPSVDADKCLSCGKCSAICPVLNTTSSCNYDEPECYAYISGEKEVLDASSSGGAFTSLARAVFNKGGVVYGAAWNGFDEDTPLVRHQSARTEDELVCLRKSKYMQSFIGYVYRDVKRDLDKGDYVLFSGCPCQIAGLKAYLNHEYLNLFVVDLLCGNSPSEEFFRSYLRENFGQDVASYEFRYKEDNWRSDCIRVGLKNGDNQVFTGRWEDDFQSVYHDHTMCPPHCENCIFHSVPRLGDLSIGDFWGIMRYDPSIPGKNGVSVILVNSPKGNELWTWIKEKNGDYLRKVPISWLGGNGYTRKEDRNFKSKYRDKFYDDYLKIGFTKAVHYAEKDFTHSEIHRINENYEVMRDWLDRSGDIGALEKRIVENGFRTIAIYGMGDLGKMLYRKLSSSSIKVVYAIDRNPRRIDNDLKVISPNDAFEEVDVIVVTIVAEFDAIKRLLETKTTNKIISIKDIFR